MPRYPGFPIPRGLPPEIRYAPWQISILDQLMETRYPSTPSLIPPTPNTEGTPMLTIKHVETGEVIAKLATPIYAPDMDLSGADFSDMDLTHANFDRSNLTGARFDRSTMRFARMQHATLTEATFRDADLEGANLYSTALTGADFYQANLRGADISSARIQRADFSAALSLERLSVYGTHGADEAIWPELTWSSSWINYVYGVDACSQCRTVMSSVHGQHTSDEGFTCEDCGYEYCDNCDEYYHYIDSHNEDSHNGCDDYCGCGCMDEDCSNGMVRNYSYKPMWRNHGLSPVKFGFELELVGPMRHAGLVRVSDPSEDILICKDDSSIPGGGFEIVSHPMDLDWFNRNFDHGLIPALRDAGMRTADEAGLHVHVSRKAFENRFHTLSWLNLIYRNSDALTQFARRDSTRWAQFHKPVPGELVQKATEPSYRWERYQAINCQNDYTFEMRFFRSTLNRVKLRGTLEFADASVAYTRQVKTRDVLKGRALTWTHFYEWVIAHGDRYPHLIQELERTTSSYIANM